MRIKLPASTKGTGFSPLSQARRQSMKRGRLTVGSDDEDYEEHPKRPKVQHRQHERQRSIATTTTTESEGEDADVVVDDDDHTTSRKASSSRTAAPPVAAKAKATKRPLVTSEAETEDEYVDPGNDHDEEFAAASKTVAKGKGKAPPTKAGASRPTKGKAAAAVVPERKKSVALTPTDNNNSPPSVKEEAPPPPKKRKLPTIKKNKTATPSTTAAPTTVSTSSAAAAVAPTKPVAPPATKTNSSSSLLEGNLLPPPTTNPRKPPGMAGQADFDLRDAGVYKLLFKNTGGNTPRSGLNRREKDEERRRELNKMRDEARAKRELEAKEWFDLQAQSEKVTRFEERLKRERNPVLWPNVLAAKWREVSERENQGKEEGEMAEGQ